MIAAIICLNVGHVAYADTTGTVDQGFAQYESNNGVGGVTNPNSTASGDYQDTVAALEAAGIVAPGSANNVTSSDFGNSDWSNIQFTNNQYGITSRQDLLDAPLSTQTAIENTYLSSIYSNEQSEGLTSYIGSSAPGGQVINQSALLACGERLGASGCQQFLQNGTTGNPAEDASVEQEMSTLSQYDSSNITGTPTDSVAEAGGGSSGAGQNGNNTFMYCPPTVNAAMQEASIANINQAVALASNPSTGYSLADGSAINATTASGGGQPDDFGVSTCLSNLFSFQGLNVLFTAPNLDEIVSHLVGLACSYAEQTKAQMLAPLSNGTFENLTPSGFEPYIGEQGIGGTTEYGGNGVSIGSESGGYNSQIYTTDPNNSSGGSGASVIAPLNYGGLIPVGPTP